MTFRNKRNRDAAIASVTISSIGALWFVGYKKSVKIRTISKKLYYFVKSYALTKVNNISRFAIQLFLLNFLNITLLNILNILCEKCL